jgi:hypothetical protein
MCIFKRTILRICIEAGLQSFYAKQVMIKMIMEETHKVVTKEIIRNTGWWKKIK